MKENEWVSVEDSLPGINKKVQLKFKSKDIHNSLIKIRGGKMFFYDYENGGNWTEENITHWRYIQAYIPALSEENDWINPFDRLPKIGDKVSVKFKIGYVSDNCSFDINNSGYIGFFTCNNIMYNFEQISGWIPTTEKRPDFSKLNKGDLIVVENTNTDCDLCGYFREEKDDFLTIDPYRMCDSVHDTNCIKKQIKKITRINIEDQTFEEI